MIITACWRKRNNAELGAWTRLAAVPVALIMAWTNCATVLASTTASGSISVSSPADVLTEQILSKELEIERLNTEFRFKTTYVSPWRQRRMFCYAQANGWLTEVSQIEQMRNRYKLARNRLPRRIASRNSATQSPEEVAEDDAIVDDFIDTEGDGDFDDLLPPSPTASPTPPSLPEEGTPSSGSTARQNRLLGPRRTATRGKLANAAITQLVGQAVGASGDVFELGLNVLHTVKLRNEDMTPALFRKRIGVLHHELDDLMAKRKRLVSELSSRGGGSSNEGELLKAEQKVLADLRDLSLLEYNEFHSGTKRFWVLQNTAYLVDLAKNMSGMTGNIIGLYGNARKKPRMQGGAGVFSIISGSIVLLTPAVGRVTGNLSGMAARRLVSKEIADVEVSDVQTLANDTQDFLKKLKAAAAQSGEGNLSSISAAGLKRAAVYENAERLFYENAQYQESQRKKASASLKENILFASLVAPPRITAGINQVLGGWRYYRTPPVANKLYAAGATAYASGTAVNIAETIRLHVNFERNRHEQVREKKTPLEQYHKRIETLKSLEKSFGVK